jgi:hypothetical protein
MVTLTTLQETRPAVLVDISATGACVRGSDLPHLGAELFANFDGLVTFGTIVRVEGDERGIEFDTAFEASEEKVLQRKITIAAGLQPEIKAAYDDWMLGIAR